MLIMREQNLLLIKRHHKKINEKKKRPINFFYKYRKLFIDFRNIYILQEFLFRLKKFQLRTQNFQYTFKKKIEKSIQNLFLIFFFNFFHFNFKKIFNSCKTILQTIYQNNLVSTRH